MPVTTSGGDGASRRSRVPWFGGLAIGIRQATQEGAPRGGVIRYARPMSLSNARGVMSLLVGALLAGCTEVGTVPQGVAGPRSPAPVCPAGSAWDGTHCVRNLVVTQVACPAGAAWDGAHCIGQVSTECPAGTHFEAGQGCAPDMVAHAPAPVPTPPPGPPPPSPKPGPGKCQCPPSDLMCAMKCAAQCQAGQRFDPSKGCVSSSPSPAQAAAPSPTNKPPAPEFDRGAAATALAAAAGAAKGCSTPGGPTGTVRVRVVYAPTGKISSAQVEGAPIAGTPVGGCIAAAFRGASIPPFDGSPVSVSKSVSIP